MKDISEQKSIINEKKVDMIVSASAGSGKTFVMIERILKILLSKDKEVHANLDEMLILTFTNQAANEMSQRLETKLMEKVDENPELVEQLDLIRVCDISTIHAFCQKMLKKYFYQAKISANFGLLEESKRNVLFDKCIKVAISDFKSINSQRFEDMASHMTESRGDFVIEDAIKFIDGIMSNQIESETFEQDSVRLFDEDQVANLEDYFNKRIIEFCSHNKKMFARLIENLSEDRIKLKTHLRVFFDHLDMIREDQTYEQNARIFLDGVSAPRYSYDKKDETEILAIMFRDKFKKRYSDLCKKLSLIDRDKLAGLCANAKQAICDLIEICKTARNIYNEQKSRKNVLDFSDLEHKFLKLLENKKVCESIAKQYKYIFVDEFQDTNPVQMAILSKLDASTLMSVGDIKQSIYGFRGSTPKIFQDMMERFSNGDGGVAKKLNCNFRSNKDILNFANIVFSKIMTVNTCGINYEKDSMFEPYTDYPRMSVPSVEICLVDEVDEKEDIVDGGVYDLSKDNSMFQTQLNKRNEARMIAQKILKLKSQKIYDEKLGVWRDTNFSDFMILMRSRKQIDLLCQELISCGVPVVASSKQELAKFAEVRIILDVLKLLQDRNNDICILSLICSFFGGVSFDECGQIRQKFEDEKYFSDCVKKYASEIDDDISLKIKNAMNIFDKMEKKFEFEGLVAAVKYLIFDTGYYIDAQTKFGGAAKCERLDALYSLIESGFKQVRELLDYFDCDDGPQAPNFSTGDQDFVGINTIHSSKGLEYPIVILFDCDRDFSSKELNHALSYCDGYGFAVKFVDDDNEKINSLQKSFVLEQRQKMDLAEELRLLYVAMTRARNILVMSGVKNISQIQKIEDEYDVLNIKNYIDLVLGVLDDKAQNCLKFGKDYLFEDEQNFYSIELFCSGESENEQKEQIPAIFSKPNDNMVKQLNQYINFDYSHKNSINLCQKNSVSSLAFDDDFYASKNLSPKRFEKTEHEESGVAANDVGTLYHLIFEKIDFSKHYSLSELNQEISSILNGENVSLIDAEKVQKIMELLRPYISGKLFREKEFIAKICQSELVDGGEEDSLIVQGKIDLLVLGEKNYIFDYKVTKINDENMLIKKYQKQLLLYKLAVQKAINQTIDEVFVVDVNHNRLIKCKNI